LVGLALLLGACVPLLPHWYFEPEAAGGRIVANVCWKTPDHIAFDREPAVVTVSLEDDGPRNLVVRVAMFEGHRAEVLPGPIAVRSVSGTSEAHFEGLSRGGNRILALDPVGLLVSQAMPHGFRHTFWLIAAVEASRDGPVDITLPPIKVDEQVLVLPPIHFTPASTIQFLAPIQC